VFILFGIAAVAAFWIEPLVVPAAIVLFVLTFALWARAGRIRRLARDGVAVPGLVEWTSGPGEEAVLSTIGGFRRRAIVSYEFDGKQRKLEVRVLNPALATIVVTGETLPVVVDPSRPGDAILPLLYLG
jgi:hypothetical protein